MPCFEFTPPDHLLDDIQCFWQVDNNSANTDATHPPEVLAADAGADIVLMATQPAVVIVIGPRSEPMILPPPEDGITLFGLRFWPGAINRYLQEDQGKSLLNQILDAKDLWPDAIHWVEQQFQDSDYRHVDWSPMMKNMFAQRDTSKKAVETVVAACKKMRYYGGDIRIDELASELAVSQRVLQRYFTSQLGLTPKQVARISRLRQSCVSLSETQNTQNITQQFTDQAHLIKECKAMTGSTPKELIGRINAGEILQYDITADTPIKK